MRALKNVITLLILTAVLVACATSPTGRKQLMLVSEEQAISSSKQAYVATVKDLDANPHTDSWEYMGTGTHKGSSG